MGMDAERIEELQEQLLVCKRELHRLGQLIAAAAGEPLKIIEPVSDSVMAGRCINAVARRYGVTPAEITGRCRTRQCSDARKMVAYMLREKTAMTFEQIGDLLGHRDHTSAIFLVNSLKRGVLNDPAVKARANTLMEAV